MKRKIKWLVVNALMAALLWFGFGPDRVDGARYLYTFWMCFTAFVLTFTIFSDQLLATARGKSMPIPRWLDVTYDVASIAFLVWHGYWGIGLLLLWSAICIAHIYNTPAKEGAPA